MKRGFLLVCSFALFSVRGTGEDKFVDEEEYDCASTSVWTLEQTLWCCDNERIGCYGHVVDPSDTDEKEVATLNVRTMPLESGPILIAVNQASTTPKVASKSNSQSSTPNIETSSVKKYSKLSCMSRDMWSSEKREFCCRMYSMGCPAAASKTTTSSECNRDCPQKSIPVCGTDEVTYRNECLLELQSCLGTPIRISHMGPCSTDIITVVKNTLPSKGEGCCQAAKASCVACQRMMSLYDYCNWPHDPLSEEVEIGCEDVYNCNTREVFSPMKRSFCERAASEKETDLKPPVKLTTRMGTASLATEPTTKDTILTRPSVWTADTQPHDPVAAIAAGIQEVEVEEMLPSSLYIPSASTRDMMRPPVPFPPRFLSVFKSTSKSISLVWAAPELAKEQEESNLCPGIMYTITYAPKRKGVVEEEHQLTVTTKDTFMYIPHLEENRRYYFSITASWANDALGLYSTPMEGLFKTRSSSDEKKNFELSDDNDDADDNDDQNTEGDKEETKSVVEG